MFPPKIRLIHSRRPCLTVRKGFGAGRGENPRPTTRQMSYTKLSGGHLPAWQKGDIPSSGVVRAHLHQVFCTSMRTLTYERTTT